MRVKKAIVSIAYISVIFVLVYFSSIMFAPHIRCDCPWMEVMTTFAFLLASAFAILGVLYNYIIDNYNLKSWIFYAAYPILVAIIAGITMNIISGFYI